MHSIMITVIWYFYQSIFIFNFVFVIVGFLFCFLPYCCHVCLPAFCATFPQHVDIYMISCFLPLSTIFIVYISMLSVLFDNLKFKTVRHKTCLYFVGRHSGHKLQCFMIWRLVHYPFKLNMRFSPRDIKRDLHPRRL